MSDRKISGDVICGACVPPGQPDCWDADCFQAHATVEL